MKYHKLPQTDLKISAFGLGTWVLGGDHWGGSKESEGFHTICEAMDRGVNFIDTAPVYGFGRAEQLIGKAISGRRDQIILATKCGLSWEGKKIWNDLSPATIRKEIEASLRRLQTDYIDLYQCHWPDPKTPLKATLETLQQLKDQGKIRWIGVSNFSLDLLRQAMAFAPITTMQAQYSALDRRVEKDILPYCRAHQVGFLAYGALGGGVLSGKYRHPLRWQKSDARSFFYKYYDESGFQKAQRVIEQWKDAGQSLPQAAFEWVLQKQGVSSVLVGCRNKEQLRQNLKAFMEEG